MNETLFLYLAFGIAVPALFLIELARYHNRAIEREIYLPWEAAVVRMDQKTCGFFRLVSAQAKLDFNPFRCPPWRWFRYRNLLRAAPPESERPYHQDQSIAE